MTSKKNTRRALFSSIVSLILCCSMLMGTTYAWFTDSVESASNVIKAGNLDIDVTVVEDGTETSINGKNILFNEITEWEPGVVAYENLTVKNDGTLALKYQMAFNFTYITTTAAGHSLVDVLKVAVVPGGFTGDRAAAMNLAYNYKLADFALESELEDGEHEVYGLVIYWEPTDHDNDYNMNNGQGPDLSITMGLNVFATQLEAENDSFGDDYDADADEVFELETIFAKVNADGSASITAEVAPSMTENTTTIDAPAAAFAPTDKVEVVVETSNTLFNVTDANGGVVASLDVTMTVNGQETSADLEDGSVYTVITYISKGLNVTAVEYTGTDGKDQPTLISYNPATGELVFTTNHFSEYQVIAGSALAYDAANDAALENATDIIEASKKDDALIVIPEENKDEVEQQIQEGVENNTINQDDANKLNVAKIGEQAYLTLPSAFAAVQSGETITLLKDVQIDADSTIVIPNGTDISLDLGGNTLSGVADGASGNREMFLVKGNLTVTNGTIQMLAVVNQGWGAMSAIFDVTAGGVLNISKATIENLGGTDMGFCVHLNNWGEVTLNAEDVKFASNYVGIRVFNSGYDMNNVTLKNCEITSGSPCFWVHNYTEADFGSAEKAAAQAKLLNFSFENITMARTNGSSSLVRYGMTNSIYYCDFNNTQVIADGVLLSADGNTYSISSVAGLKWLANVVNGGNGLKGKTIELTADLDLNHEPWTPIGNGSNGFNGTFDGKGHTISNLVADGTTSVGLFGYALNGGNVKNLNVRNAVITGNDYVGVIMGRGYTDIDNCHVENATVIAKPYVTQEGIYDGGAKAGAIIGQMLEGAGNTVTNCSVNNVQVYGFRDIGGVVGMVHNNNSASNNTASNVTLGYILCDQITADENENAGAIYGRVQSSATVSPAKDSAENQNFTQVYAVYDAMTLTSLSNFVNGGRNFKGETVVMIDDIDLNNVAWTPIGNWNSDEGIFFEGNFNGQDHTISNLYINEPTGDGVGLFGAALNAKIQNINLVNVDVTGKQAVAAVIGYPYTGCAISDCHVSGNIKIVANYAYAGGICAYGYVDIDNCSVIADTVGTITAVERNAVGGITAWMLEGDNRITNCSVANLDMTGWANVGGITGFVHYSNVIDGCSVQNVALTKTREGGNPSIGLVAGGFSYHSANTITVTNNTLKNITMTAQSKSYAVDAALCQLIGSEYGGSTSTNFALENNELTDITSNLVVTE